MLGTERKEKQSALSVMSREPKKHPAAYRRPFKMYPKKKLPKCNIQGNINSENKTFKVKFIQGTKLVKKNPYNASIFHKM